VRLIQGLEIPSHGRWRTLRAVSHLILAEKTNHSFICTYTGFIPLTLFAPVHDSIVLYDTRLRTNFIMSEVIAIAAHDATPEEVPLPRSSMISVQLSDIDPENAVEDEPEQDVSRVQSRIGSRPSSVRSSRSSSQTSDSSASLNLVDWEGLEKTEQEEPRDEATDEVSRPRTWTKAWSHISSLLPCYSLVSKRKMRRWPLIPKLVYK
jgi:hypothetical protein